MRKYIAQLACLLALGAGATSLAACSMPEKQHMEARPPVAGGQADVAAQIDKDQNVTKLAIRVQHLAEPRQVSANATTYVAWVRGGQGQQGQPSQASNQASQGATTLSGPWKRLGALDYDPKGQDGKLKVTTPERLFDLMITAEATAEPSQPSGHVVFERQIEAQY